MAFNHVLSQYSTVTGTSQNRKDLNLSTLVLHGNKIFSKDEWSWNNSLRMAELQAMSGQTIQIGCRSTYNWLTENKTISKITETILLSPNL